LAAFAGGDEEIDGIGGEHGVGEWTGEPVRGEIAERHT
jgi:hypothetical protein